MKDLTEKMLRDYKRFTKPDFWEEFAQRRRDESKTKGPIVNILDLYSDDRKQLLIRCYQRKEAMGTEGGWRLMAAQTAYPNLNMLLEEDDD